MPGLGLAVEQGQRRRRHLGERARAVTVQGGQAGIKGRGDGGRLNALAGDAAFLVCKVGARGQARGHALTAQHLDDLATSVVDEDRHFAAEAEGAAVGDTQGQQRGDGGIGGVAPAFQESKARVNGLLPPGHNRSLAAGRFPRPRVSRRLPLDSGRQQEEGHEQPTREQTGH